jgi:hypothetical protein
MKAASPNHGWSCWAIEALKDQYGESERGSEWEPIKILLEGDGDYNKTNTASNTRFLSLPKLVKPTQPLECYWT